MGIVLTAKFTWNGNQPVFKRNEHVFTVAADPRDIIAILSECKDAIMVPVPHGESGEQEGGAEGDDEILEFLTQPREARTMSKMDQFCAAFQAAAAANTARPGLVGKNQLGKLRAEHGVEESNSSLAAAGWIEAVTSEGRTKTGWYKAGPRMTQQVEIQQNGEPDDPFELAKWLVSKEAQFREELARAQANLDRVEIAKKVLTQLSDLKKM